MKQVKLNNKLNYEELIISNGGFTVRNNTHIREGFACAKEGFEKIIPLNEFSNLNVAKFIQDNKNVFNQYPEACLGGWLDETTQMVYLDISFVYNSKETALFLAREQGELAIFDLSSFEEIRV